MMMGSYTARLIYPIGYSRCRGGGGGGNRSAHQAATDTPSQRGTRNTEQNFREGVRFLGAGGNRSARRKPTKAGMESANQIHIQPLASCIGERKVYEH